MILHLKLYKWFCAYSVQHNSWQAKVDAHPRWLPWVSKLPNGSGQGSSPKQLLQETFLTPEKIKRAAMGFQNGPWRLERGSSLGYLHIPYYSGGWVMEIIRIKADMKKVIFVRKQIYHVKKCPQNRLLLNK